VSYQAIQVYSHAIQVSSQPRQVSSQTIQVSSQTIQVSSQTIQVSSQTIQVSSQPRQVSSQTIQVFAQAIQVSLQACKSFSRPRPVLQAGSGNRNAAGFVYPLPVLSAPHFPSPETAGEAYNNRTKSVVFETMKRSLLASLSCLLLAACSLPNGSSLPPATTLPDPATPTVAEPLFTPTAAAEPLPAPERPTLDAPALLQIAFQDAFNGWGLAQDAILRTVDGGRTWFDLTPPEATAIGYSSTLAVVDALHAWLLLPNEDYFTGVLFRTTDGGLHWDSAAVPFGGGSLQFLDPSTGRMLADRGAAAGSQAVEIFQSSDGGLSWSSVYSNDPTQTGAGEGLPFSGTKTGMTFRDAATGWVTGSRPMDGDLYLFVTRDGGSSWSQQSLPLPPGDESSQFVTSPPVFFHLAGILPVRIYRPDRPVELTFFWTADGGQTWNGDPRQAGAAIDSSALVSFADAAHAFAWDGSASLFVSQDGALTWEQDPVSLDLYGRLVQVQFVPPATGWALTLVDETGHSSLYQTTDGGLHWSALLP
jgi:photosystem II stability/assembly factor-like uncharacterized protein